VATSSKVSAATQPRDERSRDTRRRFEQWANNPTCGANTISAVYNVRMASVAKKEGYESTFGQSPFAIARGNTFDLNQRAQQDLGVPAQHRSGAWSRFGTRPPLARIRRYATAQH